MPGAERGHVLRRSAALSVAAIFGFVLLSDVQRSQTNGAASSPKLAGPLAAVAQTVRQGSGAMAKVHQAPKNFSITSLPKSARDAVSTRQMRITPNGDVQVYVIVTEVNADNLSQLENAGVTVQLKDEKRHIVQALVPVTRLAQVSALPFVKFVRLPNYARRRTGSVDTEGDTILHAFDARTQLGIDGTGVKVAAISDGLKGVFATGCATCQGAAGGPISTGDLPNATGMRNSAGILNTSSGGITGQSFDTTSHDLEGLPRDSNGNLAPCGFPGAGAEGTALLEIIHDIAPGAQLSFANFQTDVEFENAVNTLAAANDVMVDDIGFFGEPYDGTSSISTNTSNALNSGTNPIRAYVTSVGNDADIHYFGLYTDSGTSGASLAGTNGGTSGDLHLFQASTNPATADSLSLGPQPYNEIKLPVATSTLAGGEVVIFLNWDDAFNSSTNEYDLYLVQHGTNSIVAASTPANCFGAGHPVDCLEYVNNTSQSFFDIVIQNRNNAAAPKHLNLYAFTPECAQQALQTLNPTDPNRAKVNFNTRSLSVAAESDAGGGVISVGAICSGSTAALNKNPYSCNDPNHDQAEFYSSLGPTIDGRTKPDIAAIDGVSITGAGNFEVPFFGTSAAAPHVAGIAALMLQAKACLRSGTTGALDSGTARTDLLNNLLLIPSVPLPNASTSPNNTFGWGRADALNSAYATIPAFNGATTLVVPGNMPGGASLTASELGFPTPQTCPMATMNWTGGCGTGPAASMNCPFGTSTLSLSASNDALDYSQPTALVVTVTDFTVAESPSSTTVTAGQSATYQVTVGTNGGAFSGSVKLSCGNLPSLTTCSFNPLQVTPGSASATSTLTITTTARGLAPPTRHEPSNRLRRWAPFARPQQSLPALVFWLGASAMMLAWLAFRQSRLAAIRRFGTLGIGFLALALLATLAACGGGSSSPPPSQPGTPAGTYNISISGTAGTLAHSATATLVVQ